MTCGEVREILFAFLDSELDAALSIELQRHLERCPDCAREAEIERTIRRHLVRTLESSASTPAFDEPALRDLLPRARARRVRLRRRAPLAAALAVALAVSLSAWFVLRSASSSANSRPLAELLAHDFEHFLEEGRPVQLASDDRQAVSGWLRAQTGLAVALPNMSGAHCKLIGGRKCKLAGRTAAFALYELHGEPASLVLVANDDPSAAEKDGTRAGQTHWIDRCKGYTVVATVSRDRVLAAVSRLPEEQLLPLLHSAAQHE
jgi:anti-sigma factor RsiW